MDTLISIGTLIALGYSIYAYVMTYVYAIPTEMGHFMMGANFIITFILLGKYFETTTKGQASQAIQKLLQLQVKEAIVLLKGKEIKTPIEEIKQGDIILVRAGDKIPVDGIIIKGESDIDEAMLTGESIPVSKKKKDEVYTGTLVINGTLHIQVTKESNQTMLAKIIDTVNDAQASKPPIQHLVDKISSYFVRVILLIAIITLLVRQWKN
jgi:Cu+-exporting ATPase